MANSKARSQGGDEDYADADSISIAQLARTLLSGWLTILAFVVVSVALAIGYLHSATYSYTATFTLVPTQGQNQNLTSQLGNLASLAGVDITQGKPVTPFTLYPEALQTREVADEVISHFPGIMQKLFKSQWDPQAQSWQEPKGTVRDIINFIKPILGVPSTPWVPPDGADLQQFITQNIKVLQEPRKPGLTLSYSDPDPAFAKQFLLNLHNSTDGVLRRITLERASKYASYLEGKLAMVQVTEFRQVLLQSLSEQETLVMMSSSATPFAAQPLGSPVSSLRPTEPKPIIVLILGGLIGMLLGGLTVTLRVPNAGRALRSSLKNPRTVEAAI